MKENNSVFDNLFLVSVFFVISYSVDLPLPAALLTPSPPDHFIPMHICIYQVSACLIY